MYLPATGTAAAAKYAADSKPSFVAPFIKPVTSPFASLSITSSVLYS